MAVNRQCPQAKPLDLVGLGWFTATGPVPSYTYDVCTLSLTYNYRPYTLVAPDGGLMLKKSWRC